MVLLGARAFVRTAVVQVSLSNVRKRAQNVETSLFSTLPPHLPSSLQSRRPFASYRPPAHEVLGLSLPSSLDYASVKSAFLSLAKRTHPDTASSSTTEPPYKYTFREVRSAFESLLPYLRSSSGGESDVVLTSFDNWFAGATNNKEGGGLSAVHAFQADQKTLSEIADASESLARGGLDRGGMWALADMIAAKEREERERGY